MGVRVVKKTLIFCSIAFIGIVGVLWFIGMSSRVGAGLVFNAKNSSQPINLNVRGGGQGTPNWEESLGVAANSRAIPAKTNEVSAKILEYFAASTNASVEGEGEGTQEFVNSILQEASKKTEPVRSYALSELVISDDESAAARLAYDEAMLRVYETQKYPELGSEMALFLETTSAAATEADVTRVYGALTKAQTTYGLIAESFANVQTPRSQSPRHLKVVNAFAKLSASVREIKRGIGDPVGGTAGISMYLETARSLLELQK